MGRILISGFLLVAAGLTLSFLLVLESEPSIPSLTSRPEGISQSTVSDVRIPRTGLVTEDGGKVWLRAKVGTDSPRDSAVLVNLKTNESEFLVESAEPFAWLGESRALFSQEISRDPLWKRVVRWLGGHLPRRHVTRFYCIDLATSSVATLAEVESESTLVFCSISPDRRWMVATWGPGQVHEISLDTGTVSPRIDEKYVWAPCFTDPETYLFVGETSLQARKVGEATSQRASQPLLQEIRDAIKLKGTPSIEVCGRIGGVVYAVDHVPDGRYDRLLRLDERTRVMQEVTQLAPSRSLPDFSPDGLYLAYQGNPFDRTQDTVYFQEVLEGSKPSVLIQGISGQVNEADPVFLPGERVLYVHRGTELRSIHLNEEQPTLHWPQSLLP